MAAISLAGLSAAWLGAVGTTVFVDDNTCPAFGSGTSADPYCRIQDAMCAAMSGSTVSVAPGTYPEAIRMKPGVSLISQGGPAVTTINSTGKPCTETDYCTKRTGTQCSTIIFSTGHTLADIIDGFTITGGKGTIQSNKVAGGGIFVFSSATIVNNIITNNILSGPNPAGRFLPGAGVYVAVGQPIISNNTITGNRAVPLAGTSSNPTFGYGGGIWVGFYSRATITGNIIQGNVAGDPNVAESVAGGGGIVVWPGTGTGGTIIDRNLIADNSSDSWGGAISLLSLLGTSQNTMITNNVMVGNRSKFGGAVYTYFNKSSMINNTLSGNTGFLGGGIYTGISDPNLPVVITNNIIEGNLISQIGGTGGGIYTLDFSTAFDPVISQNDLWGNEKNQCAGDRTDTTCIGVAGNFSANPLFVNRPARNFRLGLGSPAIDRAQASVAPPVDMDGVGRGVDGDGAPNSPMAGDVDVGAFESLDFCASQAETCDGVDNNCNGLVDEGFPDTDADLIPDCLDPDDDNDLVPDGSDCAPLDATAFGFPAEVTNVDLNGGTPKTLSWDSQNIGSGTHYEIVGGLLSNVLTNRSFQDGFCLVVSVPAGPWADSRPDPPEGNAWYYDVKSANACGPGTFGSVLKDAGGAGDVCANGIFDVDGDGVRSDVDCDDTNAAVAPGASEVCDGLDNDCNTIVDDGFPDTDLDGMKDCVDPDDDNDTVADGADCAPLDATAFGLPVEVAGVDILGGPATQIVWTNQAIGSGTLYDIAVGGLTTAGTVNFATGSCAGAAAGSPAADGLPDPAVGEIRYYMVKSRNACGPGTYGSPARDAHTACP